MNEPLINEVAADAAVTTLDPLLERSTSLFRRSLDLSERLSVTRADAVKTMAESWTARARARAIRDQSAALRRHFEDGLLRTSSNAPVRWFSVTGTLGGQGVSARWAAGRLRCHPSLMTQARLLVEMGVVFEHDDPPAKVQATVTGEPASVMLTLARACDHVLAVDFAPADPH